MYKVINLIPSNLKRKFLAGHGGVEAGGSLETILIYGTSSRIARATQRNPAPSLPSKKKRIPHTHSELKCLFMFQKVVEKELDALLEQQNTIESKMVTLHRMG